MTSKVVLVTGATSGIGLATAEKFLEAGYKVAACGRRKERLQKLSKKYGKKVHTFQLDVRNRKEVFEKLKKLPKEFSNISILLNNAGLALGLESAQEANLDQWEQMAETNILGLSYVTRAVLPQMVKRNSGHILNIGSIAGSYPYPGGNFYGGSKAFVHQFSLNLRADLAGTNIRVTSIEPGLCETEFSVVRFAGDKKKADKVYDGTKPLSGEDIAETIFWAATLPAHININSLEVMPTCQSFSNFNITRKASK